MIILAIETSSEACSCALYLADEHIIERHELAPRQHTQLLLPMIDAMLGDAGMALSAVDCFAFGRGPGSFTGVRIAASAIQGLALAVDRPVLGISSLAALAADSSRAGESVLAVFDARMGEVYLGAYHLDACGLSTSCQSDRLGAAESVQLPASGNWHGVGAGWAVHGPQLARRLGRRLTSVDAERLPRAAQVARLAVGPARAGLGLAAEQALPNYLRRQVTQARHASPKTE